MRVLRQYQSVPADLQGAVVAIGNFDGLHPGHLAILELAKQRAKQLGVPWIVLTFEPHPRRLFQPDALHQSLMPRHLKLRGLRALGAAAVLAQRFNAAFSRLSADAFIEEVLVGALKARVVVTGDDFAFGHKRSGTAANLWAAVERGAFEYHAIEAQKSGESRYASRAIRAAIAEGDWEEVGRLLGRPYGWMGIVTHGEQRGRTIGFPTANLLPPPGVVHPPYGVYAVRAWDVATREPMDGVANWGVKPTFGIHRPLLEVHFPGRDIDLYGRRLYVEWVAPIRAEQRFEGVEALCRQIQQDCETAMRRLEAAGPAPWPFVAG